MLLPVVILCGSFLGTYALMPSLLSRLRSRGFVVRDMYKPGLPMIASGAGLLVLLFAVAGLLVSLALSPAPYSPWANALNVEDPAVAAQLALITIAGYGIVGAFDDRFSLSQVTKAVVPVTLSLSSVALVVGGPAGSRLLEVVPWLAPYATVACILIVPVYILVVSNIVNMHSGFNGLQSGLSLILLGTLLVRVTWEGRLEANLPLLLVLGCTLAFFPFNRHPARAIEGNVGSFLVGATVGVGIVTNGFFFAGIVMMAPHVLDFMLFAYARVTRRQFVKFGQLRNDGSIESPYPYKLKFLLPYYFHLTEPQVVRALYVVTAAACAVSFLVPI